MPPSSSCVVLVVATACCWAMVRGASMDEDSGRFDLWLDPPGSQLYAKENPEWYDLIVTASGQSFTTPYPNGTATVQVAMSDHGAIHGFADPTFLNGFDDALRKFNGPLAINKTGTIDRCGWPNKTAAETPDNMQYTRRSTPMYENFTNGLTPTTMNVALVKGCCRPSPSGRYGANVGVAMDDVNGVTKPVLTLTAINEDTPGACPGSKCHKMVASSGSVSTADIYASGRYEVIANVPQASGLVWAVWTFHYGTHLPDQCQDYSCYCAGIPPKDYVRDQCIASTGCEYPTVCDDNVDGWNPNPPPVKPVLSPVECGSMHDGPDPQFLRNMSVAGWVTEVNHEIDIEIPANCESTPNVCTTPSWIKGSHTCSGSYNTANLNNYLYTQNSGTGPTYSNMCVNLTDSVTGAPVDLVGGNKYRNYTIDWHTGDGNGNGKRVDFYIDGVYIGTNNAFVPTRGSRFYVAHWGELSKNRLWNYWPDNWGGGTPGDGQEYSMTAKISEIRITPYNEPGDVMAPSITDQPSGCQSPYYTKYPNVCHPQQAPYSIPPPTSTGESPRHVVVEDVAQP